MAAEEMIELRKLNTREVLTKKRNEGIKHQTGTLAKILAGFNK